MRLKHVIIPILGILLCVCSAAQQPDSLIEHVSPKYFDQVLHTAERLEKKIDHTSDKALLKLQKQEVKMYRKLARTDSLKAKAIFGDIQQRYASLDQRLQALSSKKYIPSLDTLSTSLKFLQQSPQFLSGVKGAEQKLTDASGKVKALEDQFQKADEIKKFLKERKEYLKQQLTNLGFAKQLKSISKTTYYYSEQVNEYKEVLKDHTKAEKKAIELLSKTKLFKDFMRKNSMLASLFRLPGDPNDPVSQASLAGLQTRAQVNSLIQQQLAAGGPNAQVQFQQNMQDAQSQLNQLKSKMNQFNKSSSDDEMPEGFKPNNQKTKTFLQRLQLGTNIQSRRPNGLLPVTSDIGVSLGYMLNDKSVIGIGGSYKMGWGNDIRHINITHQGIGARSFIDWRVKGSFWISGGYEMNYLPALRSLNISSPSGGGWEGASWQRSGLIGMSKVISLKTKFFKQTEVQLLWDMLSYRQIPRTQPVVFRIGYNF